MLLAYLRAWWRLPIDVAEVVMDLGAVHTRTYRLEELIMATAAEYAQKIDAATSDIASILTDVRQQLAAALADDQADVDTAVNAALAQLDEPIARLQGLGTPGGEVPAPEPTPEPAPVDETPADTGDVTS